MDRLFTVICEFAGGTFVEQVAAADAGNAVARWIKLLLCTNPWAGSADVAKAVQTSDPPNALVGLQGVWCNTAICGDQLVLLTVVATAIEWERVRS